MFSILDLLSVYTLLVFAILLFCYYIQSTHMHWQKLNIPYLKPIPFFGNMARYVLQQETFYLTIHQLYKDLGDVPFGGIYYMREPLLIIKDLQLATDILVKDFKTFPIRYESVTIREDKNVNPLSVHFSLTKGNRWKVLRQKLIPIFSPGKVKLLHNQIEHGLNLLHQRVGSKMVYTGWVDLSLEDLFGRLIMDVVGVAALGIECDSLKSNDEFILRCSEIFNPNFRRSARGILKGFSSRLVDSLGWSDIRKETIDFFSKMLLDTIVYRRKTGASRDDLLQLLMHLQNSHVDSKYAVEYGSKNILSDEQFNELDVAANAFFFFFVSYETTHSILSLCLYEMAINEDIQHKLYAEIQQTIERFTTLNYDSLNEMPYLNAVINETLRKYPAGGFLNRKSAEDYIIEGTKTVIPKGTKVIIPHYSIHRDWRNYPNPEVFDPERFVKDQNLAKPSAIYLPFGNGPRYCLGKNFAMFQMRMVVANVVLNYNIRPCPKTEIPLRFKGGSLMFVTKCGTWVRLSKRNF